MSCAWGAPTRPGERAAAAAAEELAQPSNCTGRPSCAAIQRRTRSASYRSTAGGGCASTSSTRARAATQAPRSAAPPTPEVDLALAHVGAEEAHQGPVVERPPAGGQRGGRQATRPARIGASSVSIAARNSASAPSAAAPSEAGGGMGRSQNGSSQEVNIRAVWKFAPATGGVPGARTLSGLARLETGSGPCASVSIARRSSSHDLPRSATSRSHRACRSAVAAAANAVAEAANAVAVAASVNAAMVVVNVKWGKQKFEGVEVDAGELSPFSSSGADERAAGAAEGDGRKGGSSRTTPTCPRSGSSRTRTRC